MNHFFNAKPDGVFLAFSLSHLFALLVFVLSVIVLFLLRHWFQSGRRSRWGRYGLAALLILCEASLNIWYAAEGVYRVKSTLPLELCSISLYLCILMLLTRSQRLFQIAYFTGIGGAIQALLTPVLYYGYPHFRFIEFFTAHIVIILSVLYMVWVEGFRPTMKSIAITMAFLNVLLVIVLLVNNLTGGNYMFLTGKPETASLLDFLGPYPWYLLSLEAAAVVMFLILYLPFAFKDTKETKTG
ncbi:YwaF family protein [Paenibacillus nasutitermitis]|uniref:ABC transporter permease n=1 Tax=Paenibacillus nasutitermitis TaxID=1652958 RepID=A0A916YY62_9BACL|nr:TIGR02206 family membrane protein [Paenibacillus nasutitermitis]GGD66844.1 ABC transporter permease [Paenibacillus nasutitermitis]